MATIKVAYEVSEKAFKAVEALAVETVENDINWSGAIIEVERDDYTCVECNDEYAGTQLLLYVYDVIDNA